VGAIASAGHGDELVAAELGEDGLGDLFVGHIGK
jgi:hypothetical protein